MAKNDILGESLWDAYSDKVTTLMNNPQHQGEIFPDEAEARGNKLIVADFGAESCGDAVRRSPDESQDSPQRARAASSPVDDGSPRPGPPVDGC